MRLDSGSKTLLLTVSKSFSFTIQLYVKMYSQKVATANSSTIRLMAISVQICREIQLISKPIRHPTVLKTDLISGSFSTRAQGFKSKAECRIVQEKKQKKWL